MCCPVVQGHDSSSPLLSISGGLCLHCYLSACANGMQEKFSQTARRPYHDPLALARRVLSRVVCEVIENDSVLTALLLLQCSQHVVAMPSILLGAR